MNVADLFIYNSQIFIVRLNKVLLEFNAGLYNYIFILMISVMYLFN